MFVKRKKHPKRRGGKSKSRRIVLWTGLILSVLLSGWGIAAEWFVHHPRPWLNARYADWPRFVTVPLFYLGNPLADFTDAMDWTGHDVVYEYDTDPPQGSVTFAGLPERVGAPAPDDIRIINRGEFILGWSDRLRHPVWCAYHVVADARWGAEKRPSFLKDKTVPRAPAPDAYVKSGYDRGHLAPNYAMVTRYGVTEQRKTFLMSNIAPQTPSLNRGVWREVEHRIADLWTARYGEIWVVVGCLSHSPGARTVGATDIDVPDEFYQVILAQEGMDVRALALRFRQRISWYEWAARDLISIEELERLTGLNFNPQLPSFIQRPLEAECPSRLWPIRKRDWLELLKLRFH